MSKSNEAFDTYLKEVGLEAEEIADVEGEYRIGESLWLDFPSPRSLRSMAKFVEAVNNSAFRTNYEVVDGDFYRFFVVGQQDKLKDFVGKLWCEYGLLVDLPDEWFDYS